MKAETFDQKDLSARGACVQRILKLFGHCGPGSGFGGHAVALRGLVSLGLMWGLVGFAALRCPADDRSSASDGNGPGTSQTRTSEKLLVTSLLTDSLREEDWVFYSREEAAKLADTWGIVQDGEDPILVCTGAPYGYLRTTRQYEDFEMELEWRFPHDENGNSGILLYTSDEDKVWPDSIQVQLHQPVAGSIFPSAAARSDNEIRDVRNVARPINHWNVCRISSNGGTISVDINGKKIGEVTGCRPNRGWIGLQSEGSEVHFRRIRIREMPPAAAPEPPADPSTGSLDPSVFEWHRLQEFRRRDVLECRPIHELSMHTRRSWRRERRLRKVSHVADRESLAACCDPDRCGDRLCLDVARTSAVVVAGGGDCQHRAGRRSAGF